MKTLRRGSYRQCRAYQPQIGASLMRPCRARVRLSTVRSFERRNLSTFTLLNSHVSKTLERIRYSFTVFSLNRPSLSRRYFANRLIACSALLLFHGTPLWSRKVNILELYFLNLLAYLVVSSEVNSFANSSSMNLFTSLLCFLRCLHRNPNRSIVLTIDLNRVPNASAKRFSS